MKVRKSISRPYAFYAALAGILVLGALLRLLYLEQYPLAVNQDELSNIYDGYAIAETGADRWGQKYPLILRGFGSMDYRPPLYAWLSAIPIKLFGPSVYSGRLVSAVLGIASLVLLYLVARRMGGRRFALLALLLATFSPWHLLFSRIASEGTMLPPFFLISACYLWQQAKDRAYGLKSLLLLGLCVGLGTNTYQASKLLFFLFTLLVLFDLWRTGRRFWASALVFGGSCLLGAGPQLVAALTMPEHFFARANSSMTTFSSWPQYLNDLQKHIVANLTPDFLFFSFGDYNNLSSGRLLLVELLPFYIGLFFISRFLSRTQAIKPAYFYFLLLSVILPAALTTENPHALRASGLIVLFPLLTAAGILLIYQYLRRPLFRQGFLALALALIVLNGLFCVRLYVRSKDLKNQGMQALLAESSKKMHLYSRNYDKIFIEQADNQSYIYTIFYDGLPPAAFQQADKKYNQHGWDEFKQINQYYFLSAAEITDKLQHEPAKVLLLLRTRTRNYNPVDSAEANNSKVFLYENSKSKLW